MTAKRSEKLGSNLEKGKEAGPWREVLRVGGLPDDVVRGIEEAEYGVAPPTRPARRALG